MTSLIVHASHLPQPRQQMDFLDSTFFRAFPKQTLPTPAEIRAMSGSKSSKPPPVFIQHLGTVVKFGNFVNVAEAQSLWLVGTRLGHCLPVPEVYGWRTDKGEVFSYMRYINSATLSERWTYLSMEEKTSFCEQLSRMVSYIRQIKQAPTDPFIGSVSRQAPQDCIFQEMPAGGPFSSIQSFQDWFSGLPQRFLSAQKYSDPLRPLLPDHGEITFTHADLHQHNIMISLYRPPRVIAILDWGQSGWYLDYWEYCTAACTCLFSGEWRLRWIPLFLEPRLDELEAFGEYVVQIGAV